jgi:hypothetical protein
MLLLKLQLNLKLLLLTFNILVVLKVTSQLGERYENTRRTTNISRILLLRKFQVNKKKKKNVICQERKLTHANTRRTPNISH